MHLAPPHPVPVLPRSDQVLFPGLVLALHVAERRDQALVRDAVRGDRQIVVALAEAGAAAEDERPTLVEPGCLGRIVEVEWQPNDAYDLRVAGLIRVRLGRLVQVASYHAARVEALPQVPWTEDDPLVGIERQALLESCARAARRTHLTPPPADLGFEAFVNQVCASLAVEPRIRLGLLALDDVLARSRCVRDLLDRVPAPRALPGECN